MLLLDYMLCMATLLILALSLSLSWTLCLSCVHTALIPFLKLALLGLCTALLHYIN